MNCECEIKRWRVLPVGLENKKGLAEFYEFLTHPQMLQVTFVNDKCSLEGETSGHAAYEDGVLIKTSPIVKLVRKDGYIEAATMNGRIYQICDDYIDEATKMSLDSYSQCGNITLVPNSKF